MAGVSLYSDEGNLPMKVDYPLSHFNNIFRAMKQGNNEEAAVAWLDENYHLISDGNKYVALKQFKSFFEKDYVPKQENTIDGIKLVVENEDLRKANAELERRLVEAESFKRGRARKEKNGSDVSEDAV